MQGFLASFSDLTFDTREKEKNAIKNESYVARTSRSSIPSFLSFNEKKNQNDITSNLLDLKRKENPWKQTTFFRFIQTLLG